MHTTKYFFEKDRFDSYKHWPFYNDSSCSIAKMAEAGFYWSGTDKDIDTATCFVCGKVLDGWEPNDDPWFEHQKHAPRCAFIKLGRKEDELTISEVVTLLEVTLRNEITKIVSNKTQLIESAADKIRQKISATKFQ